MKMEILLEPTSNKLLNHLKMEMEMEFPVTEMSSQSPNAKTRPTLVMNLQFEHSAFPRPGAVPEGPKEELAPEEEIGGVEGPEKELAFPKVVSSFNLKLSTSMILL
ncbi:hypothetical protein Tco_0803107 [Tanacetum coccineum]|uniref:Uncharacterized protein n=1 Tax=Tanacetum coccineum TaxID=301880 RepID=A0ABQ5A0M5_9ASTR